MARLAPTFAFALVVPWVAGIIYPGTVSLGFLPALALHAYSWHIRGQGGRWLAPALIYALGALGPLGGHTGPIWWQWAGRTAGLVFLVFLALRVVPGVLGGEEETEDKEATSKATTKQPRVPQRTTGRMRVVGGAGSNVGSSRFCSYQRSAGVKGEVAVANKLINAFSRVPQSSLVNGVRFNPNNNRSRADVDHALVLGGNLYLVDAKQYRRGSFTELPGGLLRHDQSGDVRTIKMETAHNLWKKSLPGNVRLAPKSYVAVEGNNSVKRLPGSPIFMGSTEEVIGQIQQDYNKNKYKGNNQALSRFVESKKL